MISLEFRGPAACEGFSEDVAPDSLRICSAIKFYRAMSLMRRFR